MVKQTKPQIDDTMSSCMNWLIKMSMGIIGSRTFLSNDITSNIVNMWKYLCLISLFLCSFTIVNPIKTWFWNRENIVQTTDLGQLHISYCHPTPSFFIFVRSIVLYCVKKGEYGMPYVLRKHRFKDTFNEANPIHNGLYMK